MVNNYFLGTILPDLKIGDPPELSLADFEQLMKENLSSAAYSKIKMLRNFYDIPNLRAYLIGDELDPLGSLDKSDLEEALVTREGLPPYIFSFLDKYESKEDRLKHYPELLATYFHEEIKVAVGAVKEYLTFEREMRLVLLAFRAKQLGKDVSYELRYENPEEEIISQILAQKDAIVYEPPEKYSDIKNLLLQNANSPIALHKALLEYRFNKIEEILGFDFFSIDRFVGYMIELIMVEKWQHLDKQKGNDMVDTILKEAS